jgi:hypothetical protein
MRATERKDAIFADGSGHLFHDWNAPRKPLRCRPLRSSEYQAWGAGYRVAAIERARQWLHFWQRPYWRLTWMLQELKLAEKMVIQIDSDIMDRKELIIARFTALGMYGGFDRLSIRGTPLYISKLGEPLLTLSAHLSWQSRIVDVHVSIPCPRLTRWLNPRIPLWHEGLPKVAHILIPTRRNAGAQSFGSRYTSRYPLKVKRAFKGQILAPCSDVRPSDRVQVTASEPPDCPISLP